MRSAMLVACALGACTSSLQSARLLAPGKTQVTVAAARSSIDSDNTVYVGSVQVRHGMNETVELGVHLDRTPGLGRTASLHGVVPKIQMMRSPTAAISVLLPISGGWVEQAPDFSTPTLVIVPTLLLGLEVYRGLEVVLASRAGITVNAYERPVLGLGGSLGLHIPMGGGAIHPELGFIRIDESGSRITETVLTVGVGLSVGN